MVHQKSFLVSCLGAYNDSGVGTGGLVCVCEGQAIEIDKMDSTGLHQNGDMIYRFVRATQSIIGYSENGIEYFLKLRQGKDVHDIFIVDKAIVCISTGNNEILWFDPFGRLIKKWKAPGDRDAWHLNCLWYANNNLYVSAFGEFKKHREWNSEKSHQSGFIFELDSQDRIVTGLSGPHNPRYVDGDWIVCESHINALTIQDRVGKTTKIQLDGFTRGLTYDEDYLYVGESADRKAAIVRDFSYVTVIDRIKLEIVDRIRIPFPEIYEILLVPPDFAKKIVYEKEKFVFDFETERIQTLERQVERGFEELELTRHKLGEELASVKYVLQARDEELASIKPILQARDEELASIKPVLQAREAELAALKNLLEKYNKVLPKPVRSLLTRLN